MLNKDQKAKVGNYIGDIVLGGIDGIITTFAIVSGVEGAHLPYGTVLVLGAANIIADGLSMAVGNFMGISSEIDLYEKEKSIKREQISNAAEEQLLTLQQIFIKKGFSDNVIEHLLADLKSKPELLTETLLHEEKGLSEERKKPVKVGLSTFYSFIFFGSIPLLAYLFALIFNLEEGNLFLYSALLTAFGLFLVGALRSLFTLKSWYRAGGEILLLGGIAGGLSYYVGYLLQELAH